VDIGGFGYDCTGELLSRWYAVGIFYPYFRNHCWMKGPAQEPWAFGAEVERNCRKLIETRYRLLPYIYSLFWHHLRTGAPLLRPLSWLFPEDEFACEIDDQFLFGDHILVAPILERGRKFRSVYLPAGKWHPFGGGEPLEGGRLYEMKFALDQVPAFVKDGSIIPMADVMQSTAEYATSTITFVCYGENGRGTYFEDDGESFAYENGVFNEWRLKFDNCKFVAQPIELGLEKSSRQYRVQYNGQVEPVRLLID
jgi:alpha-glucosidase